ncbi:hypothetical protein ACWD4O_41110 [Streptomyces sp. NPDC002623]
MPHDTDPAPARGCWLTDADFLTRLHRATPLWLDIVDSVLDDGFPLAEALTGNRDHAAQLLGIPPAFGLLIEAEAAAQIVRAAGLPVGSPFGPTLAAGLDYIAGLPAEQQQQLVKAAVRRCAFTSPVSASLRRAITPPRSSNPARPSRGR